MSVFLNFFRVLTFASLFFLSSCVSTEKTQTHALGTDLDLAISTGKVKRHFRVHLPEEFDKSVPSSVVIALHGYNSNGRELQNLSQFDAFAAPYKMITVYPEGRRLTYPDTTLNNQGWNSGFGGRTDDVEFIKELISHLVFTYNVDPEKVFLVGASNGGMMSFTFACAHSEMIAGFASVVGTMPMRSLEGCKINTPVDILHIHGTGDQIVKYEGNPPHLLPAHVGMSVFSSAYQCSSELEEKYFPHLLPEEGTRVTGHFSSGCRSGVKISHYVVEGGGHTWYGSKKGPDQLTVNEFSASRIIFEFFHGIGM